MLSMDSTSLNNNKGDQFRATKLWKELVVYLQNNVSLKRRWNMMRSYDKSFTGSNAVDVLVEYVNNYPEQFPNTSTLSRENIVRLCQSFLENGVFESVNNSSTECLKDVRFEDSTHCLYHFHNKVKDLVLTSTSSAHMNRLKEVYHNDLDPLKERFSAVGLNHKSPKSHTKHKFSPFLPSRYKENKIPRRKESLTSESDTEMSIKKKLFAQKMKRNSSLVGLMLRRSSSDTNLTKQSSTSSDSDTPTHLQVPIEGFARGRLRLSQRLSFRKSLRRSSHSSHNVQSYVIQNSKASEHRGSGTSSSDDTQTTSSKLKRRLNQIIPSDQNQKVEILANKPRIRKVRMEESLKIRKECIRVRLLQLLDLPFVDSLVVSPTFTKKNAPTNGSVDGDGGCTMMQYREVSQTYDCNDEWILRAMKVIQHIPNGYNMLQKLAPLDILMKKRELYYAIRKHYSSLDKSLIYDCFADIIQALINLLASSSSDKLLEAMQLFVHLIPETCFTELAHLCSFLHEVTQQTHVRLVSKGCQSLIVVDAFSTAIVRVCDEYALATGLDGRTAFVKYMIMNQEKVFTLPVTLLECVDRKINLLELGKIDSPTLVPGLIDTLYCRQTSKEEYDRQTHEQTQAQLAKLYLHVNQQQKEMSEKKRKQWNKKFKTYHEDVLNVMENKENVKKTQQKNHNRSNTAAKDTAVSMTLRRSRCVKASTKPVHTADNHHHVQPNSDPLKRKRRAVAQNT